MELRKDPITRSWVITGDDLAEAPRAGGRCRLCPGTGDGLQTISTCPSVRGGPWSARAVVHPGAIYHIEGDPERRGQGLYDHMPPVGAHELLLENPAHGRELWQADEVE